MKAFSVFGSVIISGVTFFILETTWIPESIKVVIGFTGGIAVGAVAQVEERNEVHHHKTIEQVSENLNRQLGGQKSVTVMRLLTLLEEMKEKN